MHYRKLIEIFRNQRLSNASLVTSVEDFVPMVYVPSTHMKVFFWSRCHMIDLFHSLEDSGLKAALISKGLIHDDQWALIAEQEDRGRGGVLAGFVRADIIS